MLIPEIIKGLFKRLLYLLKLWILGYKIMKKRIKKYQLIVRCTVDSVENIISLEKKCPFRKSQIDSRYASSWGSQYEIVYSCSLKKDLTPIKSWWSKQDSLSDLEMLFEATQAFA